MSVVIDALEPFAPANNCTAIVPFSAAAYAAVSNDDPFDDDFMAGYNQTTWNDGRNIKRREKEREKALSKPTKSQLRAAVANKPEPAKVETKPAAKPAKVAPAGDVIETARQHYAAAIETAPAKARKLEKSLDYQLSQFDSTVAHFISKGKTGTEAAAIWLERAKLAADAKLR